MSFRWRFGGVVLAMALALWLIPAVAEPMQNFTVAEETTKVPEVKF